jgi:hypothetical protein
MLVHGLETTNVLGRECNLEEEQGSCESLQESILFTCLLKSRNRKESGPAVSKICQCSPCKLTTRRIDWSHFKVVAHRNQKLSCFEIHQQNFKKSIFNFSEVLHHYQQPICSVASMI